MNSSPPLVRLLLIPGLACDHGVWDPIIPSLSEAARPWIAGPLENDRIEDMALAVLKQAPPGPFALAGHSMGGRVALEMARQAPQRVLRLALLDTGWQPLADGPGADSERRHRQALVLLAQQEGMRTMGERWLPPMMHPDQLHGAVHEAVLNMIERQPVERFAAHQKALIARPDAGTVLDTLDCPVLVLCGQQDGWSPPSRHQQMADRIAGARLVVVPDCGHMSPMERPEAIAAALKHWLQVPP